MRRYLVAACILGTGILGYLVFGGEDASTQAPRPENAATQTSQESSRAVSDSVTRPRRMRAPIRASAASDAGPGSQDLPARTERGRDRNARRAEMFAAFDVDGDGLLSEEEREALRASRAQRRADRQLEFFDSNGDGKLDEDELAMQEQARSDRRTERVNSVLSEADSDADGKISRSEAAEGDRRMQRLLRDFEGVDTDSDGLVSTEELEAAMAARRGPRRGVGPEVEDSP